MFESSKLCSKINKLCSKIAMANPINIGKLHSDKNTVSDNCPQTRETVTPRLLPQDSIAVQPIEIKSELVASDDDEGGSASASYVCVLCSVPPFGSVGEYDRHFQGSVLQNSISAEKVFGQFFILLLWYSHSPTYVLVRCRMARHIKIGSILLLWYNKFIPYGTNSLICVGLCK
jgi:hypothetical protein